MTGDREQVIAELDVGLATDLLKSIDAGVFVTGPTKYMEAADRLADLVRRMLPRPGNSQEAKYKLREVAMEQRAAQREEARAEFLRWAESDDESEPCPEWASQTLAHEMLSVLSDRGLAEIVAARQRQTDVHGYDDAHDDAHDAGELIDAAEAYLFVDRMANPLQVPSVWPWEEISFKPGDDKCKRLAKAAAMIAAEIGRLKRVKAAASNG